jgi:hypothetical protein
MTRSLLVCCLLALGFGSGCGFVPIAGHAFGAPRHYETPVTDINMAGGVGWIPGPPGTEEAAGATAGGGGLNVGLPIGNQVRQEVGFDLAVTPALQIGDESILEFTGSWLMLHTGTRRAWRVPAGPGPGVHIDLVGGGGFNLPILRSDVDGAGVLAAWFMQPGFFIGSGVSYWATPWFAPYARVRMQLTIPIVAGAFWYELFAGTEFGMSDGRVAGYLNIGLIGSVLFGLGSEENPIQGSSFIPAALRSEIGLTIRIGRLEKNTEDGE